MMGAYCRLPMSPLWGWVGDRDTLTAGWHLRIPNVTPLGFAGGFGLAGGFGSAGDSDLPMLEVRLSERDFDNVRSI